MSCICEQSSEGDGYGVDCTLPNTTSQIKDSEVYTIINVCVFVNTNQKEIDIDVNTILSNTTSQFKGQQVYIIINVHVFVNTIQKEMAMELTPQSQTPLPN